MLVDVVVPDVDDVEPLEVVEVLVEVDPVDDVDPPDDLEPPDDFEAPEVVEPEVVPLDVDPCDVVGLAVGMVTSIAVAASLRGAPATVSSAHAALSAMRDRRPCGMEVDARRMPALMGEKMQLERKSGIA